MVDTDRIREENLTPGDVMDREFETPQQEVKYRELWDECPEEAPGENTHIDDDELVWERDGFTARLWSYETTHWKAHIDVPEEYGKTHARAIDVKCMGVPENGFVDDVEIEDYAANEVVLVLSENFQPTWEVNAFIDRLIEQTEGMERFQEEINVKLEVARENEE